MALPIAIGRQKTGCSLPPTSLLPSHVYSPGFQLCSHFSLGKELSAIVTYTKGLSGCFASLAQRRLRPFKTKEGTVLCLRPMKQCVGRSPGVLRFSSHARLSPFRTVFYSPVLTTTIPLYGHVMFQLRKCGLSGAESNSLV